MSWSFDRKGVIVIDNLREELEEDNVMMDAMDCGVDDFEAEENCFTITCAPDDFNAVAEALGAKGYAFASAQIEMVPPELPEADGPGPDQEHGKDAGHHGGR